MNCGLCHVCKNDADCAFPRNQIITQCEEYECDNARAKTPASEHPTPVALWATTPERQMAGAGASRG